MDLSYEIKGKKYFNIKEILKQEFHISDRLITRLKKSNQIYLNNNPIDIKYSSLKFNDIVSVDLNFNEEYDNIIPIKMNLKILYEDDYLLVIDKLAKMPVHPSQNHFNDTLSNGVKFYFDSINLKRKIRIVTRLDKETSRNCYIC